MDYKKTLTFQQLRYAVGIANIGSFSKAAESMFISQPSLTAAVHDLEREIGITVFNRTNRGVTLTPEGEEFIARANELLNHFKSVVKRYGKEGELDAAAVFLASEEARYVTGVILPVDGGYTAA